MYKKPNIIYSDIYNFSNYLEDNDVYNSELIYLLSNPGIKKSEYVVKTPYRTDIIAKDFYGDIKFEAFVIYQIKRSLQYLTRGEVIELIDKSELEDIVNKLDD